MTKGHTTVGRLVVRNNQSNIIGVFMLQQHSTVAAWRSNSPYPLLVDFTKHLLQALQLGAEALGRERIPAHRSRLAAAFQNLDSQFNAFVRMRHGAVPANVTLAALVPGN